MKLESFRAIRGISKLRRPRSQCFDDVKTTNDPNGSTVMICDWLNNPADSTCASPRSFRRLRGVPVQQPLYCPDRVGAAIQVRLYYERRRLQRPPNGSSNMLVKGKDSVNTIQPISYCIRHLYTLAPRAQRFHFLRRHIAHVLTIPRTRKLTLSPCSASPYRSQLVKVFWEFRRRNVQCLAFRSSLLCVWWRWCSLGEVAMSAYFHCQIIARPRSRALHAPVPHLLHGPRTCSPNALHPIQQGP